MFKVISSLLNKVAYTYHFAGITFTIADSHKIAQPQSIEDLGYDLNTWVGNNLPKQFVLPNFLTVMGDGLNEKSTGIINWYVPQGIDSDRVLPFIEKAIQEVLVYKGVQTGSLKLEQSKLFKIPVYRIPVIKNDTYNNRQKLPILNIANRNASALFSLLGLMDMPNGGNIDANELKQRIQKSRSKVGAFTLSPEKIPNRITVTDPGITEEQLERYLNELENLCNVVLNGNFPVKEIVWS